MVRIKSPFAVFLSKKFMFFIFAFFVAESLIFVLPRMMPSSPVDMMVARVGMGDSFTSIGTGSGGSGGSGGQSQTALELMRQIYLEKFALDQPMYVQYVHFWKRILTLDFGISYWRYPRPVMYLVMFALPWTLVLIIPVYCVEFFAGNWLGSRSAYYGGKLDRILYYFWNYLCQAPYYWLALILMYVFAINLKWFPIHGAYSVEWAHPVFSLDWFLDAAWHYVLPFLSLMPRIGGQSIAVRAMTLNELGSDYLDYGRQLGFREDKVRKYTLRNVMLPIITYIPLDISALIGQTLLVEIVFGYPGLGSLMFNGVFSADYPLLEATFMMIISIVLIGNLLTDILYGKLDPRVASGYVGGK